MSKGVQTQRGREAAAGRCSRRSPLRRAAGADPSVRRGPLGAGGAERPARQGPAGGHPRPREEHEAAPASGDRCFRPPHAHSFCRPSRRADSWRGRPGGVLARSASACARPLGPEVTRGAVAAPRSALGSGSDAPAPCATLGQPRGVGWENRGNDALGARNRIGTRAVRTLGSACRSGTSRAQVCERGQPSGAVAA